MGIVEVGDGSSDLVSGCVFECIDYDYQFYQVVVCWCVCGLQDEDVFVVYVFLDFDLDFVVGEMVDYCFVEGDIKDIDDFLGECGICVVSKDYQVIMVVVVYCVFVLGLGGKCGKIFGRGGRI